MWLGNSRLLGDLSFSVLLLAAGCNSQVATYPVTGTVRFDDGQPVPYGNIEFRNEKSGLSARGTLDKAGAFKLGTFTADDGAPVGNYRAVVIQFFNAPPAAARVQMDADHDAHNPDTDVRVAAEVSDFSTSPLSAEVRAEGENQFEFTVPRYVPARPSASRRDRRP
jgi:hypothetical protein